MKLSSLIGMLYIIVFIISPLITIWAINTLFLTSIPITFATWFAVTWIQSVIFMSKKKNNTDI